MAVRTRKKEDIVAIIDDRDRLVDSVSPATPVDALVSSDLDSLDPNHDLDPLDSNSLEDHT